METTQRNKRLLIWYGVIIILMLAVPPWNFTRAINQPDKVVRDDAGYEILICTPRQRSPVIAWDRLVIQIIIVSGIFGMISLREKKA